MLQIINYTLRAEVHFILGTSKHTVGSDEIIAAVGREL